MGKIIQKALIPAAGLGTRFLPASKAVAKEMVTLVDRPAIQYIVEELASEGVQNILVVTSTGKMDIENHFDRMLDLEEALRKKGKRDLLDEIVRIAEMADFYFIRQGEPKGLGHAVLTGEGLIGTDNFLVCLPDDIIAGSPSASAQLIEVFKRYNNPVIAIQEVDPGEVQNYGIIRGREVEEGVYRVEDLVEKPSPSEAPSNLAIVGRYLLTPEIFPALREQNPGRGGEIQLTDGIKTLLSRREVYARKFSGRRFDIGNTLGFLEATLYYASVNPSIRDRFLNMMRELLDG